jgi:hypothetical protein
MQSIPDTGRHRRPAAPLHMGRQRQPPTISARVSNLDIVSNRVSNHPGRVMAQFCGGHADRKGYQPHQTVIPASGLSRNRSDKGNGEGWRNDVDLQVPSRAPWWSLLQVLSSYR